MKRKSFIAAGAGSLALAGGLPAAAAAQSDNPSCAVQTPEPFRKGRRALVLSGGGSFGAYQAGVVQALVEQQGVSDGQPLAFDMVCGTSIGGLGGYFVATAQYSALKSLWRDKISTMHISDLKAPYNKIPNRDAGVLSRFAAAISLGLGANNGLEGILDNTGFHNLLKEYVDPAQPVHLPLYVATTDLTRQVGKIFVRRATTPDGLIKQKLNDTLLTEYRHGLTEVRVAEDDILRDVLYSTAAIPIAFDPGRIPNEEGGGGVDQYVDGGVTQNIPLGVARYCVENLQVVLVDPPPSNAGVEYNGLLDISLGVFTTMQRRILEYQVLLAFSESSLNLPFKPSLIRPAEKLAGSFVEFDDAGDLAYNWDRGYQDGHAGWQPFNAPAAMAQGWE
jgi:predicted acylesterase/phospholipase RssA